MTTKNICFTKRFPVPTDKAAVVASFPRGSKERLLQLFPEMPSLSTHIWMIQGASGHESIDTDNEAAITNAVKLQVNATAQEQHVNTIPNAPEGDVMVRANASGAFLGVIVSYTVEVLR